MSAIVGEWSRSSTLSLLGTRRSMRSHSTTLRSRFLLPRAATRPARRRFQTLTSALVLALLVAGWIVFAPIQFGGQAAYVIVNGISMEPGFHRGDLAILQQAPEYHVGDIVTYHHPQIGPIIHRIIEIDGDHYIFKGDNNSWIDTYHPTQAECIGKLWLHIPGAGSIIEQLRVPRNMAILAAILGCFVMTTITGAQRRQSRPAGKKARLTVRFVVGGRAEQRQRPQAVHPATSQPQLLEFAAAHSETLLFCLAALAFASVLLGIFAFLRPTTRETAADINYEQTGTFSYSAKAPAGVYDSDQVQTGDPVFRQVTSVVDLRYVYHLAAEHASDIHGSSRLVAEVSDSSGWNRAIELQPSVDFSSTTATAQGTLDLTRVQALIDEFERQTGIKRPQYALAVVAHTTLQGTIDGQQLNEEFALRLEFLIDPQQLQVVKASGASDAFAQTQQGMLKHSVEQPNTLALLGISLDVAQARALALIGLFLAIGGGVFWFALLRRNAPSDEAARIRQKYGPLLIAIHNDQIAAGAAVIDIATIDDLVKLAEQHGLMILHSQCDAAPHYLVTDGKLTYRYRSATTEHGVA